MSGSPCAEVANMQDEESIFAAALEVPSTQERKAFLDEACSGDETLRQRVEALLHAHEHPDSFLAQTLHHLLGTVDTPADGQATFDQGELEALGTRIGPYKLQEKIGEGGFGVVYLAQQERPIHRRVALKVIKPGMDTRQVVARFEAERQALALMDHPGIAKVFDGGATQSGRPYFVMELVQGVPITQFCDQCKVSTRERLQLFVTVCQAVQHAHQKGVIHRDLKPTNVLVAIQDDQPAPKIIDFGVAKATGQRLAADSLHTAFAQMIGTPLYMSPEQAELSPLGVDTRTDIYSLGVLLYELLTGTTPFEKARLQEASFDELRRIIREEEPPRPSARITTLEKAALSTVAGSQRSDPRRLRQQIKGDLDWIVMKCLEKDRRRRYETASSLADDIERCLTDKPIEARPPSARYRFGKFVRRNKKGLAVAAALFLMALLGAGGWLYHEVEQRIEMTRMEREAEAGIQEGFRLFKESRLGKGNPTELLAAATRHRDEMLANLPAGFREQLEEMTRTIQEDFKDDGIAERFDEVRMDEIEPLPHGAESRNEHVFGRYSSAFHDYGIDVEKLDPTAAGQMIAARPIRAQLVATLDHWAGITADVAQRDRLRRIADVTDPDTTGTTYKLRHAISDGDLSVLLKLAETADPKELTSTTLTDLGMALFQSGKAGREAVALLRKAQLQYPGDFWVNRQLAHALLALNPPERAEALQFFYASLAVQPQSERTWRDISEVLLHLHRPREAIAAGRKASELHRDAATGAGNLGDLHAALGEWEEAAAAFADARKRRPYAHWYSYMLATLRLHAGDVDAYRDDCREMLKRLGKNKNVNRGAHVAKTCFLGPDVIGDMDQLRAMANRAANGTEQLTLDRWYILTKGLAEYRLGEFAAAVNWLARTLGPQTRGVHIDASAFAVLAMAYHRLGEEDKAITALASGRRILDEKMPNPARGRYFQTDDWFDWLHAEILCREAEALLAAKPLD
jgi:serine/threonine protein kinase/tetratricopeptide (TPR) repeat protein